jgi:hypothetical protein
MDLRKDAISAVTTFDEPGKGELSTLGSVDSPLTELNAPDDDAPAPQGGKLFSELPREYLKDREGEPPIEPDDEPT